MSRVYNTKRLKLFHGDAIEELKEIPDNRIDALITDPPAGIGFMGKDWDKDKGGRDKWIAEMAQIYRECLRVMKPGAHGLVWALPRTSHWTATALEDAGFEVRDVIMHIFGTGFPKNMDVAKAIDKMQGVEFTESPASGVGFMRPDGRGGYNVTKNRLTRSGESSDLAKQWEGWGTALKPACEHWILVRKPISEKSVAANVLKYGTGVINVDGSRIEYQDEADKASATPQGRATSKEIGAIGASPDAGRNLERTEFERPELKGRYPTHVILDEQSAEILDEQSGERAAGHFPKERKKSNFGFGFSGQDVEERKTEKGGASRFFYVAKPSKAEKDAGLESREATNVNDGRKTSIDNPYQRGDSLRLNTHPTVKPIKLMEYLCNLICPPDGIVLDPFLGSGTTGIAALNKGFRFVGIEREEEYLEIAQARLLHALDEVAEAA